jgi:hypothetical protein
VPEVRAAPIVASATIQARIHDDASLATYILQTIVSDCQKANLPQALHLWAYRIRQETVISGDWYELQEILTTFASRLKRDYSEAIQFCNSRFARPTPTWTTHGSPTISKTT